MYCFERSNQGPNRGYRGGPCIALSPRLIDGPTRFGCWRSVWFAADNGGAICPYPAGCGSRRDSFVTHLVRTRGAGDCRDSRWLSSGSTSRLPDHAFQKGRRLPFDPRLSTARTGTANTRAMRTKDSSTCQVEDFKFQLAPQPPMHVGSVPMDPAPDGCVIHRQPAFGHQFFQISEAQGKPAIPPHAGHNDDRLKLALPEQLRREDLIASTYQIHRRNSSVPPPPQPLESREQPETPIIGIHGQSVGQKGRRRRRGDMVRSTRETVPSETTVPSILSPP